MQTEVGRIAGMIEAADETTSRYRPTDATGKSLTILILVIAAIVFAMGMWRQAESLIDMLLTGFLAVAAIPEGLPAIVTITPALGTN